MRPFLRDCLLFLSGLLLLNVVLYLIVRDGYYAPYESYKPGFRSVLLADSHGTPLRNHTDTYGVLNFSAGSDSYPDMLRKIRHLQSHGGLESAILSVDDHMLSPYRERANNLDRSVRFADFGLSVFPEKLSYYIVLFNPKSRSILKISAGRMMERIKGRTPPAPKGTGPSGWALLSAEERIRRSMARSSAQFPQGPRSERLFRSLADIVDFCGKQGIRLIGVKFPLAREYIGVIPPEADSSPAGYFRDKGIQVLDFRDTLAEHPEFFANEDHLNESGGVFFAEMLSKSLRERPVPSVSLSSPADTH